MSVFNSNTTCDKGSIRAKLTNSLLDMKKQSCFKNKKNSIDYEHFLHEEERVAFKLLKCLY